MRTLLYVLLIIMFSNLGCKKQELNPSGLWLGDYTIEDRTYSSGPLTIEHNGLHRYIGKIDRILYFMKDSLVTSVLSNSDYNESDESRVRLQLIKDSIIFKNDEMRNSMKFSFSNTNKKYLILQKDNPSQHVKYLELHFFKLKEFNMAEKKEAVSDFLRNNPIVIGGRTDIIELQDPHWQQIGHIVQDSIKANYGSYENWYIYSIGSELFVEIGDQLIHVSNYDNEVLFGHNYRNKDSIVEIKKSTYTNSCEVQDLIGEWIIMDNVLDTMQTNSISKIEIHPDSLIVHRTISSKLYKWKLNKYKNKIIFSNDYDSGYSKYWKIENLLPHRLVIKTKVGNNRGSSIVKTMSFYKN